MLALTENQDILQMHYNLKQNFSFLKQEFPLMFLFYIQNMASCYPFFFILGLQNHVCECYIYFNYSASMSDNTSAVYSMSE